MEWVVAKATTAAVAQNAADDAKAEAQAQAAAYKASALTADEAKAAAKAAAGGSWSLEIEAATANGRAQAGAVTEKALADAMVALAAAEVALVRRRSRANLWRPNLVVRFATNKSLYITANEWSDRVTK